MKIRRTSLNDLDKLLLLIKRTTKNPFDEFKQRRFLEENLTKNNSDLFIAIDNHTEQFIGMIQAYRSYSTVGRSQYHIIGDLHVDTNAEEKNIAKELLAALEKAALQSDYSHIELQVIANDKEKQQLFSECHYEKDEEYLTFVKDVSGINYQTTSNAMKTMTRDSEFNVRKAVPSDLDDLLPLLTSYLIFYKITPNEKIDKSFLTINLTDHKSDIFVAVDSSNKIVGFTQLYRNCSSEYQNDYYILFDLFVVDSLRNKGIGSALLNAAAKFAHQQEIRFIELQTATNNITAQQLYKKHGYTEKNIICFIYNLPKIAEPNLIANSSIKVINATKSQEQIWHDVQTTPKTLKYNMSWCWKITGSINPQRLENAWKKLVADYPSLHSYFRYNNKTLYQVLNTAHVPQFEIRSVDNKNEDQIMQLINNKAHNCFDLEKLPLCFGYLFIAKENTSYLGMTFHHMTLDGHSIPILMKKFSEFHQNIHTSNPLATVDNVTLLNKYMEREKQHITLLEQSDVKNFWHEYLNHIPKRIGFKVTPQATEIRKQQQCISFGFSKELTSQIETFAENHKKTIFMVMSTLFSMLLFSYSHQKQFIIGYPSGRRAKEFSDLVGYHVNLLPLVINMSLNKSFIQLLEDIQKHRDTIKQNGFDHYSYLEIVKVLGILPLNNSALFNVIISPTCFPNLSIPTLPMSEIYLDIPESLCDLMLSYEHKIGESFVCVFEYNTHIFSEEFIHRFVSDLKLLALKFSACPDQSLHQLQLPINLPASPQLTT